MATITMGASQKGSKLRNLFLVWVVSTLLFILLMIQLGGNLHWPSGNVTVVIEGETTEDGGCSGSASYRYETSDPGMSHEHQEPFNFPTPCDETGQLMALLRDWAFKLLLSGTGGLLSTILFGLGSIWRSNQLDSED